MATAATILYFFAFGLSYREQSGVKARLVPKIEIKIGWENKPRVLEHEIGHALGFKDNNTTGHIMNHAWNRGGYKKKGLQREEAD